VAKWMAIVAAIVAVVAAPVLILIITRGLLGITYDSLAYLGLAESIRAGEGLVLPFTIPQYDHPVPLEAGERVAHWAPGYPLLLSLFSALQIAVASAGISAAMAAGTARVALGRWSWHAPAAAWMVTLSPSLVFTEVHVFSEPPFIALALACTISLAALERSGKLRWVVMAGVAAAATLIVRYLGVAIVAAAVLGVARYPWETWRHRTRAVTIVGIAPLLASALLMATHGPSLLENAAAVAVADGAPHLGSMAAELTSAVLELIVPGHWGLGIALGFSLVVVWLAAPVREAAPFTWPFLASGVYLLILVVAHLNATSIPFDLRLLSPVASLLTVGVVLLLARRGGPLPAAALAIMAFIWMVSLSQLTPHTWDEAWDVAGCADGGPARICDMLAPNEQPLTPKGDMLPPARRGGTEL
jgi:hypothetical protein